MQNKIQYKT